MSTTPFTPESRGLPTPRVRHQARDAAALMAFSAVTSVFVATLLMLLANLGR